jgi:uncharacterized membrane protein YeaQ/YmgE (transglycosylase-associated protein family)
MLAVLGWIVFGLVIGLVARSIMPGAQPMGFILTALLGIAGSFVGGWLGTFLSGAGGNSSCQSYGTLRRKVRRPIFPYSGAR